MIPISLQISQSAAMRRTDMCLFVSAANRRALDAIIADRNSSSKAVWLALAGTLHRSGRQGARVRQDASAGQGTTAGRCVAPRSHQDCQRNTATCHTLEPCDDGGG